MIQDMKRTLFEAPRTEDDTYLRDRTFGPLDSEDDVAACHARGWVVKQLGLEVDVSAIRAAASADRKEGGDAAKRSA